jgi:predicted kinase
MRAEAALAKATSAIDSGTATVFMMCGVAGSGKTTFAQNLQRYGCVRLSIDEEIWSTYGRYGIDYAAEKYLEYQQTAEHRLRRILIECLERGSNVVIDYSFWRRSKRDEYRALIKDHHRPAQLIYMQADLRTLKTRLREREQRFDANAAFAITEATLSQYLWGFEAPQPDEGVWVVEQDAAID